MADKRILFSRKDISARVKELGAEITRAYQNRPLVLIGVLNGAFIFLADLAREITLDIEIDFIRVASYGDATTTSGTIRLTKPPEIDLNGKDILLVEDIVDTGTTLAWLHQFRRLRVRYERRAEIPEAFVSKGCSLICLRHLSSP